jgi:hypothetical protein
MAPLEVVLRITELAAVAVLVQLVLQELTLLQETEALERRQVSQAFLISTRVVAVVASFLAPRLALEVLAAVATEQPQELPLQAKLIPEVEAEALVAIALRFAAAKVAPALSL